MKIMNTKKYILLILATLLIQGCHCVMYEKELIINSVKKGNDIYKFRYFIEAFPVDQILYSNKFYYVGDTIKCFNN